MKKRTGSSAVVGWDEESLIIPAALVAPFVRVLERADEAAPSPDGTVATTALVRPDSRREVAKRRAVEERLSRLRRDEFFPPVLFAEPGWEILLLLFVQNDDADPLTVTEVADRTTINLNTAIRWIDYLEVSKLIVRQRHERDRRATVVSLTALAEDRLTNYYCRPRLCHNEACLSD